MAGDTGNAIRKANVSLVPVAPLPVTPPAGSAAAAGAQSSSVVIVNGVAVSTNGPMPGRPKSATTDAQGMFEFKELPAGTYRLSANPGQYSAQYISATYGAKRANAPGSTDPGQPITVVDGQAFTAIVALFKGSVITGHVGDENGDSLARVQVYTLFYPVGSTRGQRFGSGASTDDLGNFRLYGLAPGDYAVVAEARGNTFVQPNAPPETEEERQGMMTTYYPGSADEGSAQRVRTRTGVETSGIEIRMLTGRMLHISGMVVDSQGKTDTRFNVQLMQRMGNNGFNNFGVQIDATGHFQGRNIPPGDYKLVARQLVNRPPNLPPNAPFDPGEFAVVPIALTADVDDLLVTTGPGATITGQVVYENGPPPALASGAPAPAPRINATPGDPQNFGGMPSPQGVQAAADLTFTMKGFAGEFLLRASAANQFMKSVQLNGQDITDAPHEFKDGDKVTITMTSRASTVEGTVSDDKGPANTGTLLLFSEDKSTWRTNSLHTRRGGVDITGHFRMAGVLPGRYYLIALPQERANALNFGSPDPSLFEQFAKEATSITVGDDEQRQVDLKISPGPGGLQP